MIADILAEVKTQTQNKVLEETQLNAESSSVIIDDLTDKIFDEAQDQLEQGNLLQLKAMFDGASPEEKKAFLEEKKEKVIGQIVEKHDVNEEQAEKLATIVAPVFLKIAQDKLLNGKKPGLMDIPKILSFIKSKGTKVDNGGGLFGGLFG